MFELLCPPSLKVISEEATKHTAITKEFNSLSLFSSSRELGFIDVSLKLLSFLQTTNVESRNDIFERKSKVR